MSKEIEEGNKLIAEFMNFICVLPVSGNGIKTIELKPIIELDEQYHYPSSLKYHYRFDWLMPVVEKIESLVDSTLFEEHLHISIRKKSCTIVDSNAELICERNGSSRIDAVWLTVIEFITWYNNLKKQQP